MARMMPTRSMTELRVVLDSPASGDVLPELRLRLPGLWRQIEIGSAASIRDDCARIARDLVADERDAVLLRHQIRTDLGRAALRLRALEAIAFAVGIRLEDGTPLACSLVVIRPTVLTAAAAIGTSPHAVLSALERSFGAPAEGFDERTATWRSADGREQQRVPAAGSIALRRHRVMQESGDAPDDQRVGHRLHAEYWLPIPATKRLVTVVLDTPLGEVPAAMLGLFDAILASAGFVSAR